MLIFLHLNVHSDIFVTTLVILGGWQYSAPPLRLKEVSLLFRLLLKRP